MYYQYFGLNEAPFSIAVNPRYLFMSPRHRDALAHLLYGVGAGGGFILLTGEVGTGKTTIVRGLMQLAEAMRSISRHNHYCDRRRPAITPVLAG